MSASTCILIVGGGGREHALALKLSASSLAPRILVAPGNDGIARDGARHRLTCVPVEITDHDALVEIALSHGVDLVVIGPELPLCQGLADRLHHEGVSVIGPTARAARLESSKLFAKRVMDAAGVRTSPWQLFESFAQACACLHTLDYPLVLKADGLAAGKGAFVVHDIHQAEQTLHMLMVERALGEAGERVICESYLQGEELSFMVLTDGEHIKPLATSKDYKRLLDHDLGPNTGGMGAVTPAPHATDEVVAHILTHIISPTLAELRARGILYKGFLYAGLMVNEQGIHVLEFNVRLGDPETQALLWGMNADLLPSLFALVRGALDQEQTDLSTGCPAICVVSASSGYPSSSQIGDGIEGIDEAMDEEEDVAIFFAGVREHAGQLVTSGGRVLGVTARAKTAHEARSLAYARSQTIVWRGMQRRDDLGKV